MVNVLIPTIANDLHAFAVDVALTRRKNMVTRWYGAEFPTRQFQTISLDFDGSPSWKVRGDGLKALGSEIDVVWNRRAAPAYLPDGALHPDDESLAKIEAQQFEKAAWSVLAQCGVWVNSDAAVKLVASKVDQLKLAASLGMQIPETIVTNDPLLIKSFIREHGDSNVIYKNFRQMGWFEGARRMMAYTAPLKLAELPSDRMLQYVPGIYQRRIAKSHEYRITCIGKYQICLKIESQLVVGAVEDWRAEELSQLKPSRIDMPEELAEFCAKYMAQCGLLFCVFDVIVDAEGSFIFLETNEAGQFLFVDDNVADAHLLEAFVEFIENPAADFQPTFSGVTTSFSEIINDETLTQMFRSEVQGRLRADPAWVSKERAYRSSVGIQKRIV